MTVDLQQIRATHGGRIYDGGRRWVGPGPGHSRRDTSLSVRLAEDRALIHSFAGDDFRACAAHLGIERAAPERIDRREFDRRRQAREAEDRRRQSELAAFCARIWEGTEPAEGTPVETYLAARWIAEIPASVRFHPAAPHGYSRNVTGPALIALAQSVAGPAKALQATFLTPDGRSRTGRVTFGALIGATVRLAPAGPTLAVAEGLETAASFADIHGLPTWATLGTSNLEAFRPPGCVRHLVIAADGDAAGARAAHALAEKLRHRCEVTIRPAPVGFDWNDVARGKAG